MSEPRKTKERVLIGNCNEPLIIPCNIILQCEIKTIEAELKEPE
jgi:hypothetical protein